MPEPPRWRKSSWSGQESSCVEVAHTRDRVRDSKNAEGPILHIGPARLVAFLAAAKAGWFDN